VEYEITGSNPTLGQFITTNTLQHGLHNFTAMFSTEMTINGNSVCYWIGFQQLHAWAELFGPARSLIDLTQHGPFK